MDEEQHVFFRN